MFDKPQGADQPTGFDPAGAPGGADFRAQPTAASQAERPPRWSPANWPVRRKVLAIALVPLLLAVVFGGLRIYGSATEARDLRLAANRAALVPAIADYMAALENALVTVTAKEDPAAAVSDFDARHDELAHRLGATDAVSDVRLAVTTLLDFGKDLLAKSQADTIDLRQRVTTFAPLLLTAETAINGSVRGEDDAVRSQAEGLGHAVGAQGQMAMQQMMVERGGDLPDPDLRSSMVALAGAEPSTVTGMGVLLGAASNEASALRSQMVERLSMLSDPSVPLAGNEQMLASIQKTNDIAQKLIGSTASAIVSTVDAQATHQRNSAIRDAVIVIAVFLLALAIVWWVARSLTRPLRTLRDGALRIAHVDLADGIERVKAGDDREPAPLPIQTTEEVGQVAHAVDQLHAQALLLAGDEARLRVMVDDMFETLSRRNKSLVDQQLALIDRLERNEEDPDRLDSLFRLDHLATRMRRNGANLLVLAGAQPSREHGPSVSLASLVNAASSEVEEYQRVETGTVPDGSLIGSAAGDSVHLLAELIDNALRYSPPSSAVRVTAVHTSDAGVLIDVNDTGLGMTDGDLRIANMRLNAGGEVSPDNTRHMGLFVVGRLARQHGMVVRLMPAAGGVGTVAQVYLPPELMEGYVPPEAAPAPEPAHPQSLFEEPAPRPEPEFDIAYEPQHEPEVPEASVTVLPRRSPGSSGITETPAERPFGEPEEATQPAAGERWWTHGDESPAASTSDVPANTSGFFASRRRARRDGATPAPPEIVDEPAESREPVEDVESDQPAAERVEQPPVEDTAAAAGEPVDTGSIDLSDMDRLAEELSSPQTDARRRPSSGVDLIYQNMVSEWLDPQEVQQLAVPQDWKSVWDNGWAAAAEADNVPVESHTDHGLPVRAPGARLIPGGAPPATVNGSAATPRTAASPGEHQDRDPEAIRASMSNHFDGVRAARSRARNTSQGPDDQ